MTQFRQKVTFQKVEVEKETENALLCWIDGQKYWIPKGQIDDDSEVFAEGHSGDLIVSEWIATEKGLT